MALPMPREEPVINTVFILLFYHIAYLINIGDFGYEYIIDVKEFL